MARFVMDKAIDLKLGTYIPLGDPYSETMWQTNLMHGLVTRWRYLKTQKMRLHAYYLSDFHEIFMVGTPSRDTSHFIRVFDLTYFSRSQRSKRAGGAAIQQVWHVL